MVAVWYKQLFTNGAPEEAKMIFDGIIEQISELMVDPFGKYLVQKLLQKCDGQQMMHIICEITKLPGQLIQVACDMHGSFVVRKMINRINTPAEAYMIVSSLSPGAVTLMMDAHGSYLAQRCLEKLSPQNKKFLLDAAIKYCFGLARGCHSCRILNLCIDNANEDQRDELLYNITSRSSALDLSRHQYGNYVIQHILGLKVMWATDNILDQLEGHNGYLSMQQCSSNVVEKCIKAAQQPRRLKIIQDLINYPKLHHLLHDMYGNYVIQTALRQCENDTLCAALIGAIEEHAASLRKNVYGKRILSTIRCLKC
ncbi:hypothetical protein BRADI_4g07178v3 [Brachypodium distachyon]|uniref:PUM-HD domain-containing protein n=1 Tax=Brachypodium distachyon TaxID=15368 RepID=A0A0Q3EG52_BRADI|nr:hypothetical protein BRADI_4g07178v3 [Brachypodium distachyon]PNT62686.1 hypothetical protein BRADI_4g07178v3 [Brachypodium distachyon]